MSFLRDFLIRLGADTADYDKKLASASTKLNRFANDVGNLGSKLTFGLSLPMAGAGAAALKVAANMEQVRVGMNSMLGSVEKGGEMMRQLQDFAAKTPFEFPELADTAKRMMALGFSAREVLPALTNIGDAVAALGGGSELVNRVTVALGQMKAKGVVSAEEVRQLAEAGIPAWDMIAKKIGVDVPTAMKMAENKAIDAQTAIAGIMQGMQDRFGGMMSLQSQTLSGLWSNLKDTLTYTLNDIGKALLPTAKSVVGWLQEMLQSIRNLAAGFGQLPAPVQKVIVGLGAMVAGVGPALMAIGALGKSIAAVGTVMSRSVVSTLGFVASNAHVAASASTATTALDAQTAATARLTAMSEAEAAGKLVQSAAYGKLAASVRNEVEALLSYGKTSEAVALANREIAKSGQSVVTGATNAAAATGLWTKAVGLLPPALMAVPAAIVAWDISKLLSDIPAIGKAFKVVGDSVVWLAQKAQGAIGPISALKSAIADIEKLAGKKIEVEWLPATGMLGAFVAVRQEIAELRKNNPFQDWGTFAEDAAREVVNKLRPDPEWADQWKRTVQAIYKDPKNLAGALGDIKSTSQRKDDLKLAREQYQTVLKSSEADSVKAEALKRVRDAEEALYGTQKRRMGLQELITKEIKDEGNKAINSSVAAIADWRTASDAWGQKLELVSSKLKDVTNDLNEFTAATGRSLTPESFNDMLGLNGQVIEAPKVDMSQILLPDPKQITILDKWEQKIETLGVDAASKLRAEADMWGELYEEAVAANRPITERVQLYEKWTTAEKKAAGFSSENLKQQESAWKTLGKEVQSAMRSMSRGIADAIVEARSLGDVFADTGKAIAKAILEIAIEQGVKVLIRHLTTVLDHLGAIGKALEKWAGVGASIGADVAGGAAGAAAQTAGTVANGAGGVAGSAGSAAGSAAGAVGSGVMGTIGAVGAAVGAVSSVIGNFQMHGMNVSLGRIEENTRFAQIALIGPDGVISSLRQFLPSLDSIRDVLWGPHLDYLRQINDNLTAKMNITVPVYLDSKKIATAIVSNPAIA